MCTYNMLLKIRKKTICSLINNLITIILDSTAQWVGCPTADLGVTCLIRTQSHTFVEIVHEIFLWSGHSPPSVDLRRVCVSYKRKCTNYWLTA